MKTKDKSRESILKELRKIRDQINKDIENMSYEELVDYFKKKKPLHPAFSKDKK